MDNLLWIIGIVIGLIVVVVILSAAFRGMRPKAPEAQVYRPSPTMPRAGVATSASAGVSSLSPTAIAEIDRLVAAGQKMQAIKLVRQHTGAGLKDAKDRIDHWSVSTTAPHLAAVSHANAASSSITPASATPASVRAALPAGVGAEIDRLVAGNQQIVAIKLLREHTGLGLKDTKNLIERWRA